MTAAITGNYFDGKERIINKSHGNVGIESNTAVKKSLLKKTQWWFDNMIRLAAVVAGLAILGLMISRRLG